MNPDDAWVLRRFHGEVAGVFGNRAHRVCSYAASGMARIRSYRPARRPIMRARRADGWAVPHEAGPRAVFWPSEGSLNSYPVAFQNRLAPAGPQDMVVGQLPPAPSNGISPMSTFFERLLNQADRDDPIGDLARDILADATSPSPHGTRHVVPPTYVGIRRHLRVNHQASVDALDAVDHAYIEYLVATSL